MIDYDSYVMSIKLKIMYSFMAAIFIFAVSYLFYRNILFSTIVCPFGILYLKIKQKQLIAKRRNELNLQFKDLLISLAASLSAGRALENAFESALEDLFVLYPSDEAFIIKETKVIIQKLSYNITIEEAIGDFAKRSDIDDIINFADVMSICKRTGGNLIDAIKNSAAIISDKIEMKQEIDTVLSARKFEQKILNVIPIGMVLILSITASEYIKPVFTTIQGRVVMTIALVLLAISFCISNKIMNIKM
ncbi:type II secretion system F family protein [Ruminiclostridium herbifermentans]|uniref:Type II secretion system F family protein n=1 Tax=Ruminiclostridium herbifermentans TaxID=2488810 RepID=A0A4U7JI99_9FIRM|nr:type II secretion system F family protein [Ruminiclostridium herbifermentans]QNU65692.1 type II secretion system F family protein [Ruminiclostridium herbifermentans]